MNFIRKKSVFAIAKESVVSGITLGVVIVLIGIAVVFVTQDRFRASADFMLSSTQEGQDYYTATRSAEYMSRVLGEVLYSENFIGMLVDTGRVDGRFLPQDKKARLNTWSKMLDVKKNSELGFVQVSISGSSDRDVSKISQAIVQVLSEKSGDIFGDNSGKVKVRLLSGPIVENNPSASLLSYIAIFGLIFGCFVNFAWNLIREEIRVHTN
jgi:hypothetical protein